MRLSGTVSRRAVLNAGMARVCVLRPRRVAFAHHRATNGSRGSLNPSIDERMAHEDDADRELLRQERLEAVEKAFPYLQGNVTSDTLLKELEWIRSVYMKPLSASTRINLRSTVRNLINDEGLPQETIDGLVKLIEEYGAL
jgi:hypothetical protein